MKGTSLLLISIIIVAFSNNAMQYPSGPLEGTFIRLPQKKQSAFQICKSDCSSNFDIKPVCGSDGKTYPNQFDLECSRRCGKEEFLWLSIFSTSVLVFFAMMKPLKKSGGFLLVKKTDTLLKQMLSQKNSSAD